MFTVYIPTRVTGPMIESGPKETLQAPNLKRGLSGTELSIDTVWLLQDGGGEPDQRVHLEPAAGDD